VILLVVASAAETEVGMETTPQMRAAPTHKVRRWRANVT
jgi:hypothetical protein